MELNARIADCQVMRYATFQHHVLMKQPLQDGLIVPSIAHEGIQLDSGNKWTFSTLRSFASHVVLDHRDSDDIVYSFWIAMVIAVS